MKIKKAKWAQNAPDIRQVLDKLFLDSILISLWHWWRSPSAFNTPWGDEERRTFRGTLEQLSCLLTHRNNTAVPWTLKKRLNHDYQTHCKNVFIYLFISEDKMLLLSSFLFSGSVSASSEYEAIRRILMWRHIHWKEENPQRPPSWSEVAPKSATGLLHNM